MKNFDAVIDRQTLRGIDSIEVARMIAAAPRHDRFPELDAATLKDIGFDNSMR